MTLHSIQSLRALAALLVVLYHLSGDRLFTGQAGVDIFFVISGFIMGTVDHRVSAWNFIIKRVERIVPLYWFVTTIICIGAIAGVFSRLSIDINTIIKSLLFIPYFNPEGQVWPIVVPGWSLNVEMLFYAIFAAGLLAGAPIRFACAVLLALAMAGYWFRPSGAITQAWTTPLLLEFIAGLMLARLNIRGTRPGLGLLLCGVAGLCLAAVAWRFDSDLRPLVWGIPAALIVAGSLTLERSGSWPTATLSPLAHLGDASYSLYLTHGTVIAFFHRKVGTTISIDLLAALTCIVVAFAAYYGFERPVRLWLRRSRSNETKEQRRAAVEPSAPRTRH